MSSISKFLDKKSSISIFTVILLALSLNSCTKVDRLVESDGTVDWNRYYSTQETYQIMQRFAELYPDLTKTYSIGKSYLGADLLVMEITNKNKPADEKPALYVDGNIHSGELTGSAVTLYFMAHLLNNYYKDPEIKQLVDTRTFYVRPKFNPDGADLALLHDVSLRSSVRPIDNDGDGVKDDDPAEDLNGDGFIVQMRYKDPNGRSKISAIDPRIMERRGQNESGGEYYTVVSEGIDNDGDGRFNEDGIGGLDLNRNFPRNWELQYLQPGAGPFPLSEPETHATVKFINSKPNITGIVHNHTSGGFVYRLPSTGNPADFPPDDIELIKYLGEEYTRTTGRRIVRSYTSPERHRYGTLISWGYWDQGIIGWVPEYWPGIEKDYDGDGQTSEQERLRFNDEELNGKYFLNWTKFDHPGLGEVEIGGWRRKFVSQNPPAELLEAECAMQMPWILYLAKQSPLIEVSTPVVTALGEESYRVEVTVTNTGYLPTNLTERGMDASVIPPVTAELFLSGGVIAKEERRKNVGHLAGSRAVVTQRNQGSSKTVSWVLDKTAMNASFSVKVVSTKGGTIETKKMDLR